MKKITMTLLAALMCMALLLSPAAAAGSYDDHLLMKDKAMGSCKELTGTVEMVVVFVSLPDAPWDIASIAQMNQTLRAAADTLAQEAAAYGAQLSIVHRIHYAQASVTVSMDDSEAWADELLAAVPTLQERTSDYYHGKPVIFCINTGGRAFAHSEYSDAQAEYAVIFGSDDAGTVRHELLHLYGAWDYYLLDDFTDAAEMYCPDSIMLSSDAQNRTDSLTAYLIGWTDTLDAQARALIAATEHVTHDLYEQAHEGNTITGWATVQLRGGEYTGMLEDGSRHGFGEMRWENGDSYSGTWTWDALDGMGTYTWADGDSYTGSFVDGSRTGKGTMTWADGASYTGDFVDGERTGKGTIVYADGDAYSGDFTDGSCSGKGIYIWADGDAYTGDFVNGERTGKGTYTWANGDVYTGDFVNGERTGKGTYTWANGDMYTGDFVDGKRTGKGTYVWADGESYTGSFADGQSTGRGTIVWNSGNIYTGGFASGQRTGEGVFVWADGDVYIGGYVNGLRTGQGTYFWTDGSAYSGGFVDNIRQGYGVYRDMEGTVLDGQWDNGDFVY